jgi:hypothetical protein
MEADGLCGCGCGLPAPLAPATNKRRGIIKGQPQKYIRGHPTTRKPRKDCAAEGCKDQTTRNYCVKHEFRLRRHGDLIGKRPQGDAELRFWLHVEKTDGCWIWTGSSNDAGYGVVWTDDKILVGAHRFSYELHNEPITGGLFVLHRCDNPPCVNPEHLFLGTAADNVHDMIRKGRNRNGRERKSVGEGK